jgi:hypothetical protein
MVSAYHRGSTMASTCFNADRRPAGDARLCSFDLLAGRSNRKQDLRRINVNRSD